MDQNQLRKDIESAINRASAENGSNTPDFILAEYLVGCLLAYDRAVKQRDAWYGVQFRHARSSGGELQLDPSTTERGPA